MCSRYFLLNDVFLMNRDMRRIEIANEFADFKSIQSQTFEERRPGEQADGLIKGKDRLRMRSMRWGFANPRGGLIINARVETMHERVTFSALAEEQRCAMPASGYYEWRKGDHQKYVIAPRRGGLFYLAGLYRVNCGELEFVVLTQACTTAVREIHDRMPVLLEDRTSLEKWLNDGEAANTNAHIDLDIRAVGDEQLKMEF